MSIDGFMMDKLLTNATLCRSVNQHLVSGASLDHVARAVRVSAAKRGLRMNMRTAECFVFTVGEMNHPDSLTH
jgi:hypothetical protein